MGKRGSRGTGSGGRPESFPRLDVTVEEHEGYAVVTVAGEVDITTGSQLRDPLLDLIDHGLWHHVVDLCAVTFIDSSGLGILVGDHKRLRERSGSLQVICGPGQVARVFRLTAVDRVIPVRDTVEAAVAVLAHPNSA
jgi:anti-anti-sigma factor